MSECRFDEIDMKRATLKGLALGLIIGVIATFGCVQLNESLDMHGHAHCSGVEIC